MYIVSVYATLCLMGFSFVVAGAFGFVAMRSSPGRSESEIDVLEIRKKAVEALQTSMTVSASITGAGYRGGGGVTNVAGLNDCVEPIVRCPLATRSGGCWFWLRLTPKER